MTTRVILHGGNTDRNTDKNEKLFKEIIDGVGSDTVKVLCIYFARPKYRWEDSYDEDQHSFKRVERDTGRKIETKLATSDMATFREDVAWADVIFINGGVRGNLKETLLSIGAEQFWQMLDGKTLVGISAGANVLSKYYYSSVIQGIREGAGFLDIKLLTHYSEDEPGQMKALQPYGENLPIVVIPEEEYVLREQP
jgi:peptidase E